MRNSFYHLCSAFFAFVISYSIALSTGVFIIKNAVLAIFFIQWILFIPAYKFQTEKFFDLAGSLTYLIITNYVFIHSCISNEMNLGNLFLCLLIVIWAVRLGYFLFSRVLKNGEDKRFKLIKVSPTKFFMTWTLQGMWISICSLCSLTAISSETGVQINYLFYLGFIFFIFGFLIEIIADIQKNKFRSNPQNKNKFINSGLWYYSRHPNYLGEIILWLGISVMSFSSLDGYQYFTLISPIFTYCLLVYISGVNILEKNGQKKWGHLKDYQEYIKNTPKLLFDK